jgi:hypothetical protein
MSPFHRFAAAVAAALAILLLGASTAAGDDVTPPPSTAGTFDPPVDAVVLDPYRAPSSTYGAGNRGLTYLTEPGTPVRAAADGVVTFAGPVGGELHVTVAHPDGFRTTYSFLAAVAVTVGRPIVRGDVVGTAGEWLHFGVRLGVRLGEVYVDPTPLLAVAPPVVHLVPHDKPLPPKIGGGGALGAFFGLAGDAVDWLDDQAHRVTSAAIDVGVDLLRTGDALLHALFAGPCTASDVVVAPPPERRVAVLVGGLGSSTSDDDEISVDNVDIDALGYDGRDVIDFSYAGGRTPPRHGGGADSWPGVPMSDYGRADTAGDIAESGRRLAELLIDVAASAPGTTVDVYAHSLGGVVTRVALAELASSGRLDVLEQIDLVATLGSPHNGADLATIVQLFDSHPVGSLALDATQHLADLEYRADSPAAEQLDEHSDFVEHLRATPVPPQLRMLSVAARGDLIVAAPRSEVKGARNVIVTVDGVLTDHGDLPGAPEATRELSLALAGLDPACESLWNRVADAGVGHIIGMGEHVLGVAAFDLLPG